MLPKYIIEKIEDCLYTKNEYGVVYQIPKPDVPQDLIDYFKENHNIRTDVHDMCIACQIRQLYKYDNEDEFKVKCNFVPRTLPKGSAEKLKEIALKSNIPEDRAKKLLLSTIDPVAWAELMFGFDDSNPKWRLRSYQKSQLRCSSSRMVLREGRRSGKTFSIALKLLYLAYNMTLDMGFDGEGNPITAGPEIVIVTPYQAQLTGIFDEMERLIKRNRDLRRAIASGTKDNLYIKSPIYSMTISRGNGAVSTIEGYVSGLGVKGDGSGGGTVRGQGANIIYLDEMDMIPEDIIEKVIEPLLLTAPDTIMIATSTPIGKRARFFKWCTSRSDYKEDHYPSTVLPHWEAIKKEVEEECTKDSFMTEYMAVFLEGQYGVFAPTLVQEARADYNYFSLRDYNEIKRGLGVYAGDDMLCSIGIDWNKNAGTEFYVLGYSPADKFWFGLEAKNIAASEYSARRWVQELLALNYKWKPNWIYADEGYGESIIEDVKFMSYQTRAKATKSPFDQATARLYDILKPFNFSQNVILKDPVTNVDIKKPGKLFLVENAVRTLEDSLFKFPVSDEVLRKQFLNYVTLKENEQTGKPVYGMENRKIGDHRLDAFMLALAALTLEESVYSGRTRNFSLPSFVSKNILVKPEEENADKELLEHIKQGKVPGFFSILDIVRDKLGKPSEKARKDKPDEAGKKYSKRGNFNREESEKISILSGLQKVIGTPMASEPIGTMLKNRKGSIRRGFLGKPRR